MKQIQVRYWRDKKHWTQSQLAAKVGVQTQTISNIETGRTVPQITTLQNLAKALGVSIDQLYESDEKVASVA